MKSIKRRGPLRISQRAAEEESMCKGLYIIIDSAALCGSHENLCGKNEVLEFIIIFNIE
jgi:hypothetical protein